MGSSPIRVIVVEDDETVRYLLSSVVDHDGRFEIVGETESIEGASRLVADHAPDLVLIDIHLEGEPGTTLIGDLRSTSSELTLVAITSSTDDADRLRSMEAGADDVINKREMTTSLLDRLASLVATRTAAG